MKKRQTASEPEHASDLFAGVWVATDQAGEQMEIEIYNHPERDDDGDDYSPVPPGYDEDGCPTV